MKQIVDVLQDVLTAVFDILGPSLLLTLNIGILYRLFANNESHVLLNKAMWPLSLTLEQ